MAIPESAAAIATDECERAAAGNGFLPHMGIEIAQRRFALEQEKKIFQRSLARPRLEPSVDCFDEGQIVWRIDRQAATGPGERRIGGRARNTHEIGIELEIAGDMFARDRIIGRIHHQLVEPPPREGIHTFMRGNGAIFEQNVIAILIDQRGDEMIHEACIDEGRIGGNPHDDIGIGCLRCQRETRQHVIFRPADDSDSIAFAEFDDGIIERIGAGRDGDLGNEFRTPEAAHDMPKQRFARDGFEHLARKPGRPHAGLHDGDDAFAGCLTCHAAGFQLLRMCRSGRMPSAGSARHSRSSISEGCGPLKPVPSATIASRSRAMTGAISPGSQQWPEAYSAPCPSRSRWNSTTVAFQRCTARSITAGLRV